MRLERIAFVAALLFALGLGIAAVVVLLTRGPSLFLNSIVASTLFALLLMAGVWPRKYR
jgi:hypothetical protein